MTAMGYVIVILGTLSASVNLMHLIDRLERPQRSQRRRTAHLRFEDLKKLGVVLKRAQFFLLCDGRAAPGLRFSAATLVQQLKAVERGALPSGEMEQLSLFDAVG